MQAPARPGLRQALPLAIAWAGLLTIETLGQVALKLAGSRVGVFELDAVSIHAALATPWLWLGLACYLGQFAIWMTILERSALSAAFPASAIVLVTVMLASWRVFNDPMGWEKLLGAAIIVVGILLVGSGVHPATDAPPPSA